MTKLIQVAAGLLLAPRSRTAGNNALLRGGATLLALNFNSMSGTDYAGIPKGRIDGTVKEHSAPSDLPLSRMTYLHRQRDGRRVGGMLSSQTTGAYSFTGIDQREKYFVVAFDHTLNYNAVVKSDVTPDIMT